MRNQQDRIWRFLMNLKRAELTTQQYRTLKGQALSGDLEGAMKGLGRLLKERRQSGKKNG